MIRKKMYFYFVEDRKKCIDAFSNCEEKIASEPGVCREYPDFAWQSCPASCGVCKDKGITKHSFHMYDAKNLSDVNTLTQLLIFLTDTKCTAPENPPNAVKISKESTIGIGELFEYDCSKRYALNGGNLRRACLPSGKLSGKPPECVCMYLPGHIYSFQFEYIFFNEFLI